MKDLNERMQKRLKVIATLGGMSDIENKINEIDVQTLTINQIWDKVFDLVNDICISRQYFQRNKKIYCGFTLSDIKDSIFQSILCSLELYQQSIEYRHLTQKQIKYIVHATGKNNKKIDINEPLGDLARGINRHKHKIAEALNFFSDENNYINNPDVTLYFVKWKETILQDKMYYLDKPNFIGRSLELVHFMFSSDNDINKNDTYIPNRHHMEDLKKMSNNIARYISNPSTAKKYEYYDKNNHKNNPDFIYRTNQTALMWDFEDIFHTNYVNHVVNLCIKNFPDLNDEQKLYYIYCMATLRDLPPIWLFGNNNNIINLINTYLVNTLIHPKPYLNLQEFKTVNPFYFLTINNLYTVYYIFETIFVVLITETALYNFSKDKNAPDKKKSLELITLLTPLDPNNLIINFKHNKNCDKNICIHIAQQLSHIPMSIRNKFSVFKEYISPEYSANKYIDDYDKNKYVCYNSETLFYVWLSSNPIFIEAIAFKKSYSFLSNYNYIKNHFGTTYINVGADLLLAILSGYRFRFYEYNQKVYTGFPKPQSNEIQRLDYDKEYLSIYKLGKS